MATIKQLLREFWIPFTLAIIWTTYELHSSPIDQNFAGFAKTFSAAFFLASWATSQFVRVNRQARTENSLKTVETRLAVLATDLEAAAGRLVATVTGGQSFCYLMIEPGGGAMCQPWIVHCGDYTLSNLNVRMCDLNRFASDLAAGNPTAGDHTFYVGEFTTESATRGPVVPAAIPTQDWNVFFSARNGRWTQEIRGRFVCGEWLFALIVTQTVGKTQVVLKVQVPHGFPTIADPKFDSAPRQPPIPGPSATPPGETPSVSSNGNSLT